MAQSADADPRELDRLDGRERHRRLSRLPQWRRHAVATVQTTNYTDTGLTAATAYSYTVSAVDAATSANVSAQSAAVSATTDGTPPVGGLDGRPSNTTCLAGDRAGQHRVHSPCSACFPACRISRSPSPCCRSRAIPRAGTWCRRPASVRVFDNTPNVVDDREFINIASRLNSDPGSSNDERGLLGMAFHPNYPTDPRVYLLLYRDRYRRSGWWIAYRSSGSRPAAPRSIRPARSSCSTSTTRQTITTAATSPSGPTGSSTSASATAAAAAIGFGTIGNGQHLTTLLGKMLRIDVSAATMATTYAIPSDESVRRQRALQRQRHRHGELPRDLRLWLPQSLALEFRSRQRPALAQRRRAGRARGSRPRDRAAATTAGAASKAPITLQRHACGPNRASRFRRSRSTAATLGFSTTGGFVYRGSAIPALHGRYVFGDFGSGNLWHIARDTRADAEADRGHGARTGSADLLVRPGHERRGVHRSTRRHVASPGAGHGRRPPDSHAAFADRLRERQRRRRNRPADSFPMRRTRRSSPTVRRKTRWLALPDGQRIVVNADNDFEFPNGSVLMKNFSIGTHARRDAPLHAPQQRQLGRLHL